MFSIGCCDQSILGPLCITDQERVWHIPEQPEICILWVAIWQLFKNVEAFVDGFCVCVLFCFMFPIWELDHAFKSQRSQKYGKIARILVYSCRTLLRWGSRWLLRCCSCGAVQLWEQWVSVVVPARVAAQWSRAPVSFHSFLGIWKWSFGLQKENEYVGWTYCISGYGTENILKKIAVSKNKVQSFAKTVKVFEERDSPGQEPAVLESEFYNIKKIF